MKAYNSDKVIRFRQGRVVGKVQNDDESLVLVNEGGRAYLQIQLAGIYCESQL